MPPLTRPGLFALLAGAGFAALGDATEIVGRRSPIALGLSAVATFVGLGLLFLGLRESVDVERRRLTRLAAVAWVVSFALVAVGGAFTFPGATIVRAAGGAAFAAAPVLAAWRLGHVLPRYVLAAAAAFVGVAYVVAAALQAAGLPVRGLPLAGNVMLFAGYWMTIRTFRA